MKSEIMNFKWKDAVWLALDDCGDYPTTQDVYSYVQKYRQLTEHQREIDNQGVMERYKNTVRNILNDFRRDGIIEGAKENPELKYGEYNWIGVCAKKESRKEIRKEVENQQNVENNFFSEISGVVERKRGKRSIDSQ